MEQMSQPRQNPLVLALIKKMLGVPDINEQPFTDKKRADDFRGLPPGAGSVRGMYNEAQAKNKLLPPIKQCTGFE